MSDIAAQTPLVELARSVPKDLRAEWPSQWWEDGTPCGHSMAPVGRYLHDLAGEVDRLTAENRSLKEKLRNALTNYGLPRDSDSTWSTRLPMGPDECEHEVPWHKWCQRCAPSAGSGQEEA